MILNDDLLEYIERLDGVVDVSLAFNPDDSVILTVNQVK
jgi:nitrate reductase NapAB chaperone NapD